jgi:hypothetical protein
MIKMQLNKLFTDLLIFGLCVNISIYLLSVFNLLPVTMTAVNLSDWTSWFNISAWNILLTGATTIGIGLASILLRQGVYAVYAMLLTALSMIITPISGFLLAFPNLIGTMLPPETNPLAYTNGVFNASYVGLNPIVIVVSLIYAFAAYWFIFGLVIQRDVA